MCLETLTGKFLWRKRVAGNYRASPIYAAGRIYLSNLEGNVTVIAADREFRELARNQLEHGFQASPAVYGKCLILRSTTSLYCIEDENAQH